MIASSSKNLLVALCLALSLVPYARCMPQPSGIDLTVTPTNTVAADDVPIVTTANTDIVTTAVTETPTPTESTPATAIPTGNASTDDPSLTTTTTPTPSPSPSGLCRSFNYGTPTNHSVWWTKTWQSATWLFDELDCEVSGVSVTLAKGDMEYETIALNIPIGWRYTGYEVPHLLPNGSDYQIKFSAFPSGATLAVSPQFEIKLATWP